MTRELISLQGKTRIIITEYIPFGVNNIVAFNEKLESAKKVQQFLLTDIVDQKPERAVFQTHPVFTKVNVVEFKTTEYTRFLAQVFYPETGGEVQEEEFGVDVDVSGRVTYGVELIKEKIHSIDHVSKIVSDLVSDSSKMMDTLITNYQKRLLDLTYCKQSLQRDKLVIVTATSIEPSIENAGDYLKKPELRSEIEQLVSTLLKAFNLEEDTRVIIGQRGILLISPSTEKYEGVLTLYSQLSAMDMFQTNTFARLWMAWDALNDLKRKISGAESIAKILEELNMLSGDITMFEATLSHIDEDTSTLSAKLEKVRNPGSELINLLKLDSSLSNIRSRIEDARLVVTSLHREISGMRELISTLYEKELRRVWDAVSSNTAQNLEVGRAVSENTKHSVAIGEALEVLEAGIFGVYILEFAHVAVELSGKFEEHPPEIFGLPLPFWLVIIPGLLGVIAGWKILQIVKKRTLKKIEAHS